MKYQSSCSRKPTLDEKVQVTKIGDAFVAIYIIMRQGDIWTRTRNFQRYSHALASDISGYAHTPRNKTKW